MLVCVCACDLRLIAEGPHKRQFECLKQADGCVCELLIVAIF
jgi:hypothetical protein